MRLVTTSSRVLLIVSQAFFPTIPFQSGVFGWASVGVMVQTSIVNQASDISWFAATGAYEKEKPRKKIERARRIFLKIMTSSSKSKSNYEEILIKNYKKPKNYYHWRERSIKKEEILWK